MVHVPICAPAKNGGVRDGDPPRSMPTLLRIGASYPIINRAFPESPPRCGAAFVVTTSNRLRRFNWLIVLGQAIAARGKRPSRNNFYDSDAGY
jgi:hypothetical protein